MCYIRRYLLRYKNIVVLHGRSHDRQSKTVFETWFVPLLLWVCNTSEWALPRLRLGLTPSQRWPVAIQTISESVLPHFEMRESKRGISIKSRMLPCSGISNHSWCLRYRTQRYSNEGECTHDNPILNYYLSSQRMKFYATEKRSLMSFISFHLLSVRRVR